MGNCWMILSSGVTCFDSPVTKIPLAAVVKIDHKVRIPWQKSKWDMRVTRTRLVAIEVERCRDILGYILKVEPQDFLTDWVQDESNRGVKYDSKAFDLRTWKDGTAISWHWEDCGCNRSLGKRAEVYLVWNKFEMLFRHPSEGAGWAAAYMGLELKGLKYKIPSPVTRCSVSGSAHTPKVQIWFINAARQEGSQASADRHTMWLLLPMRAWRCSVIKKCLDPRGQFVSSTSSL